MKRPDPLRRVVRDPRGDQGSPIPTLDRVAPDSEAVLDQSAKAVGDSGGVQSALAGCGEAVSRQRRRDDLMARLDQERDQPLELQHRARPAVDENDRRSGAFAGPDVVDSLPSRVVELVQPRLGLAPVVIRRPVLAQAAEEPLIHPVLPADVGGLGPACALQALAEIVEIRFADSDLVGTRLRHRTQSGKSSPRSRRRVRCMARSAERSRMSARAPGITGSRAIFDPSELLTHTQT